MNYNDILQLHCINIRYTCIVTLFSRMITTFFMILIVNRKYCNKIVSPESTYMYTT